MYVCYCVWVLDLYSIGTFFGNRQFLSVHLGYQRVSRCGKYGYQSHIIASHLAPNLEIPSCGYWTMGLDGHTHGHTHKHIRPITRFTTGIGPVVNNYELTVQVVAGYNVLWWRPNWGRLWHSHICGSPHTPGSTSMATSPPQHLCLVSASNIE